MAVRRLQDKDQDILFKLILLKKTKAQLEMLIYQGVLKEWELRKTTFQGKRISVLKMSKVLRTWEPRTLIINIR